ncbi:kinesin-like protein KIF22-A isoform X2 [Panicum miliaceum]|uniref:Kinesin-like protein KIF22-A isoform X2 n=1 Tax=Panicum miliaceum TaxID=4540 RepID=A0A3L6RFC4_PANMI|nr:kinesin-like protein KIF22-A isoform X2 [Panicum miliaceum]
MEDAAAAAAIAATPSASTRSTRSGAGPVRVVARICPGGGSRGSFQVAARVSDAADSSSASVSFIPMATPAAAGALTTRKDHEYKLDYCYLKDDSSTRIFNNEVKHLLDDIFCGEGHSNACVITCGAAAKTDLIMGFQDHPGLLTLAMEQILHRAKPTGAEVSVSSYQVLQDSHVFDLLEPKDSEVHVLDDADGRTHLKGLSKVDIKSIEEFSDLCCGGSYKLKHSTKPSNQIQTKGHQGFVIYISRFDRPGRECAVSKINFLDLAGCVDTKQKNCGGGFAPSNYNKSLSEVAMHSAKKPVSSASTSINMKHSGAKSILSGRRLLFSPTTNSSKGDNRHVVPTMVVKTEEVQSSLGMAIQALSPFEDHSSSDSHAENSYTDFGLTCSSDIADEFAEQTPVCATQSSPKLSDRLKEISNSLKLLSTRPLNITKQKPDMVCAQPFYTDVAEPKTPAVHLKFGHAEDLQESLKGRSTGIKGIGEKRANYILELRKESPEPLKNITKMMSAMVMDSEIDKEALC